MKRLTREGLMLIGLVALLVLSVAGWWTYRAFYRVTDLRPEMQGKLLKVMIPVLVLKDATLDQAITQLNDLGHAYGLPANIEIRRWSKAQPPKSFHPRRLWRPPGEGNIVQVAEFPSVESEMLEDRGITVTLTYIPLYEALTYIAGRAECGKAQRGNTIFLVPGAREMSFGPFVTRSWTRPSYTLRRYLDGGSDDGGRVRSPEDSLFELGVSFYDGSSVVLQSLGNDYSTVVISNAEEQVDYCEMIFGPADPTLKERVWRWLNSW